MGIDSVNLNVVTDELSDLLILNSFGLLLSASAGEVDVVEKLLDITLGGGGDITTDRLDGCIVLGCAERGNLHFELVIGVSGHPIRFEWIVDTSNAANTSADNVGELVSSNKAS
jgi:hypothetical protein